MIFVISDSSDPSVFSDFSTDEAFSSIASAEDGIISINGMPSIHIQAALTETYFDRSGLYFLFPVGNGSETSFNGSSYTNSPLLPGVRHEISYYIIFYDQNGVSSFSISVNLIDLKAYFILFVFSSNSLQLFPKLEEVLVHSFVSHCYNVQ